MIQTQDHPKQNNLDTYVSIPLSHNSIITMSHLSLFNYLKILNHNRDRMWHVTVTVTVTIIKVIATVKIIWVTLMDLIEFNMKIM